MSASTPLATFERTFQNRRFVPKAEVALLPSHHAILPLRVGATQNAVTADGATPMKNLFGGKIGLLLLFLVVLLLAGLPAAVWMDLTSLAEANLNRQASDLNSVISSVRSYYATNVVGRILAAPGVATKVVHNYEDIPGAIPIPATLSLELGRVISERQHNIT